MGVLLSGYVASFRLFRILSIQMDTEAKQTNNQSRSGCANTFVITLGWFFVGGVMSWGPLLSYGADARPIFFAIVAWVILWFTAVWFFNSKSKVSSRAFAANFLIWAVFVGWSFYDIGL
ncbi:MAG: hypothetical protein KZQ95_13375 [Candidatus Thiodiazotropha sp. (ex Epidulcina cf. delphinae)]|nr:hypothetical protein [Candidatus Thiodiazotropha sp. (ex Epidulcina cf. delphinae)]